MRSITVVFDDPEFEALKKVKKDLSWHDFIMKLTEYMKGDGV